MIKPEYSNKIEKLEQRAADEREFTEDECFLFDHAFCTLDFEYINDDATVFACTRAQLVALVRARGGQIERKKVTQSKPSEGLNVMLDEDEKSHPGVTALAEMIARENPDWDNETIAAKAKILWTSKEFTREGKDGRIEIVPNEHYRGASVRPLEG